MIEFGSLTFMDDLLRGGYSATTNRDGVEIVVNTIQRDSLQDSWTARVWVDGVSAGESNGKGAHETIRTAVRGQLWYTIRQVAALNNLDEVRMNEHF